MTLARTCARRDVRALYALRNAKLDTRTARNNHAGQRISVSLSLPPLSFTTSIMRLSRSSPELPSSSGLCGCKLEGQRIPKLLEPTNMVTFNPTGVEAVKIVDTELVVRLARTDDVVDGGARHRRLCAPGLFHRCAVISSRIGCGIELGPLADPALVTPRVATALGVRETAEQPLTSALSNALRQRHMLLVLDNCEHLLDACAQLIDGLLRTCPDVRVLATSREPVGIGGEVAWRVPSLELPDAEPSASLEKCSRLSIARMRHHSGTRRNPRVR